MRQLRRAPFGWLLALLFPLLVSGGAGAATASAFLHAPALTKPPGDQHPFSRQLPAGERHHVLAPAPGNGSGGGHPVAAVPPDARHLSISPGLGTGPARRDDPRPLAALLVRPGRAPPSSTGA
ncbi:hypothetical protein GCM10010156_33900 [Planobispora rosea]|uniref:Secreted protein n=1 Tax=Planobispora rosea TaxID=35762 RepID=A0A8J3S586_PLARO|nr:hypothetical protein [Planobispora rosea]GGS72260.1 hypothetical protein GCM10010156_33900 [Planobispora rosea]GIH85254.1 hypothetical protein Pro02_36620 [Planobispora rosea]